MTTATLEHKLNLAFQEETPSDESHLIHVPYLHDAERDFLVGRTWKEFFEEIKDWKTVSGISLLNREGLIHFLPALLLSLIHEPAKDLGYDLAHQMLDMQRHGAHFQEHIPPNQLVVLHEVLDLIITNHPYDDDIVDEVRQLKLTLGPA